MQTQDGDVSFMETLFWVAVLVIFYVYAGYPLLLAAWARLVHRAPRKASIADPQEWPSISIIIAARNEAPRLPGRISNLLELPYPGRREIVVVSDGSTDNPAGALAGFGCREERSGAKGPRERRAWRGVGDPAIQTKERSGAKGPRERRAWRGVGDPAIQTNERSGAKGPRERRAWRGAADPAIQTEERGGAKGPDVRLIELPAGGKSPALNAGVAAATGDIVVFADARQDFCHDALMELVANFADAQVGGATGELVLDCEIGATDSSIADGVGLYWKYEKWLRRNESRVWSTLGATGAIYALRRRLWRPLPAATLLDDVLAPMRAVLDGWRVVFDDRALALDRVAPNAAAESQRKIRTLAGNCQILALEPRLLLPFVNPVWLQYLSHKVGRLVVPWALLVAFATSAVLARESRFYAVVLVLQMAFCALAALGGWLEKGTKDFTAGDRDGTNDETAGADRVRLLHDELRRAGGALRAATRARRMEIVRK